MTVQIDRIDGLSSSTAIKGPCRAVSTSNRALTGLGTVDGVALADKDRVLLTGQTDAVDNGIWVADTGVWRRARDFSSNRDIRKGTQVFVTDGSAYARSHWVVSSENPVVVGTTEISFTRIIADVEESESASFKVLLISDIQPDAYPGDTGAYDSGGQVAKWRSIVEDIIVSHGPDSAAPFTELHIPGDLVDRGLPALDTPQGDYGFAELCEDLRDLAPRDRIYAISGNHDYEYLETTDSATAKSFTEYKKWFGEQFYAREIGNLVFIHMGTMIGKTQGAYPDFVFDWWRSIVEQCHDKNVIVETHHALYDCGLAGSTLTDFYITDSERFTDWMDANPGIVSLWISGHYSAVSLGGLLDPDVDSQSEAFGCTHVNVGLHIPSYMEDVNDYPMSYCVLLADEGSDEIQIERWDVETNAKTDVAGKNFTVTLPRPVQLATRSSFDGRLQRDNYRPSTVPSVTVLELERVLDGSDWVPTDEIQWAQHLIVSDQRRDDVPAGGGPGILFQVPGDTSDNPLEGVHGYGVGGAIAARRTSAADGTYTGKLEFYGAGAGQDVDSLVLGQSISSAGSSFFGGAAAAQSSVVDQDVLTGMTLVDALSVARNDGTVVWVNRLGTDGQLIGFQQDGVTQGDISVSGSTVSLTGAHLTRWAQGGKPKGKRKPVDWTSLPRGTVLSSTGEKCVWLYEVWDEETVVASRQEIVRDNSGRPVSPTRTVQVDTKAIVRRRKLHKGDMAAGDSFTRADGVQVTIEEQVNEQLTRVQVSSDSGDRAVAGVLQRIDDDGDIEVAQTGDYVIRIGKDCAIRNGDLLVSAGDGTARPQDDDLVRSSTIAKVTSALPSETYADGSFAVPCLLMAC